MVSTYGLVHLALALLVSVMMHSCQDKHESSRVEDVKPELRDTIEKIAFLGYLSAPPHRVDMPPSDQYSRMLWVRDVSTDSELHRLRSTGEGAIKALATEALLRRPETDHLSILHSALLDTVTWVFFMQGHQLREVTMSEYLARYIPELDPLSPPPPPPPVAITLHIEPRDIIVLRDLYASYRARTYKSD